MDDLPEPAPTTHPWTLNAGLLLRAARRSRRLSQRELAEHAGVPRSTVDRIESGRTDPRVGTFVAIMQAVGYGLLVGDRFGNLLVADDEHDRLRDRGFRRFPAHLPAEEVDGWPGSGRLSNWWGWGRIAWLPEDSAVPTHTYLMRDRYWDDPYYADRRWDDAT